MEQGTRVLVVDDSPLVRQAVRNLLSCHADLCVVAEAPNGREALAQVEREHPDVLVMDLHMPVMGGLAALDALRQTFWPRPIVIMVSAEPDEEYRRRALSLGAFCLLGKEQLGTLPALILEATQSIKESREP